MILDFENLFDEDLDTLRGVATTVSTDVIDLGADSDKIQQLVEKGGVFFAIVTTAFESGGAANLRVRVWTDDANVAGAGTIIMDSGLIPVADLVVGYKVRLGPIPAHISQRYLSCSYYVSGAAMTAGELTTGIALDLQTSGMELL